MTSPSRLGGYPVRRFMAALVLAVAAVASAAAAQPAASGWLGPDGQPLPFADAGQVVEFLASARVVAAKDLSTGITKPKKLTLERDGVRAHAVYHSIDRRELKVKQLPNGRFALHLVDSHRSQVAAFELSRLLGIDSVPPTVLRELEGRVGSIQLWIEGAMTEQDRRERSLEPPDRNDWNQQKADQWVFDNLINNIDRNTGNTLIDGSWNLWLIDHTRSFGADRQLPYPERITHLSKELYGGLKALDPELLRQRLSPYLRKSEIKALLVRHGQLLEALEARIARLGEDRVLHERGKPWASVEPASDSSGSPSD